MPCPHIDGVSARIIEIQDHFLGKQLAAQREDPLTFEPNLREIAAYRLLVHAEFEDYLETKATDGITQFKKDFEKGSQSIRDNWQLFIVARTLGYDLHFDVQTWRQQVSNVFKSAEDWISENNGIRDASFTKLSILSGKLPDEVDLSLAASLSSYGKGRGAVAHQPVHRVRTILSPSDEAQTVATILDGLKRYFS